MKGIRDGHDGSRRKSVKRSIFCLGLCLAILLGSGIFASLAADEASSPRVADVDLAEVEVERALRFLAELYDVSLVTGDLPDVQVTVRLRGVSAAEAFSALAAAAGLEVKRRGVVMLVSVAPEEPPAEEPFPVDPRRARLMDRVFPLGAAEGEGALAAVEPLLEPELEHVSYDATGHRLTVSVLPGTLERVEILLAELGRTPAQFEIEVKVVEISRNALKRMGAQGSFGLDVQGGLFPSTFPLDGIDDASRYVPSPRELAELSEIAAGGVTRGQGLGGIEDSGFRFGRVDARGVRLLIEFLEQSGEARVMATPQVTTLDNRPARISMVTTLRIPTFTQNAAFATTTVSGIEEIDVGTILDVRPRKERDRGIFLTVTPEVSELAPTVEVFELSGLTQGLPVVTRRRTETEVILDDGEMLVIGGLVRERETKNLGKTPGLGDLPVIGKAFRHRAEDSESSELLVFVTPRELPPAAERRAKVRVDDVWIPADLAARLSSARSLVAAPGVSRRVAGIRALETLDGDLLAEGLDVTPEVVGLGADAALEVRLEAALFLLHRRPAGALGELVRFTDSRAVALSALASPLAPHLRCALGELVSRTEGGLDDLTHHYQTVLAAGDGVAAGRLLEVLTHLAPERAAELVRDPAAESLVPRTAWVDAVSGSPAATQELATLARESEDEEIRAFARAALKRERGSTEPALAWTTAPAEPQIFGDPAGAEAVRVALDLLARRAPDLRHLVGFALAEIDLGGRGFGVDPRHRRAHMEWLEGEPQRLAHRLVRLATLVFEARVRGFPATGGRALARAVREEIRALERLTGAPSSPERTEETVREVLEAVGLRGVEGVDGVEMTVALQ